MLRYALYARKSSEERKVTEKPLREQTTECRSLAERHGLLIAHDFEESKSAKVPGKRPLFAKMVSLLETGEIDAILCWNINRLARNMEEGGKIAQLLIDGVIKEIRTPTETHRTGDNIIPLVVQAASSTQFSIDLARDVRRGMGGHVDSGGWNSKAHQGYTNQRDPHNQKRGIIVPDPDRFPLIRQGWDMMLTGAYTPAQVVAYLNDVCGYRSNRTPKSGGHPICRAYAYKLFSNPFYAGYTLYKGEVRKGNHLPMVTDEEFQRVQEILTGRTKQRAEKHEFSFTGLMRCGYCGRQITAERHTMRNGKLYVFYRCSDNMKEKCTKQGMSEDAVMTEIGRVLEAVSIDAAILEFVRESILADLEHIKPNVDAVEGQQTSTLAEIERRTASLEDMWMRGLMTDEAKYREYHRQFSVERAELEMKANATSTELNKMRNNTAYACDYVGFAHQQFLTALPAVRREIACALATEYRFYGREKLIVIEPKPLLKEIATFGHKIVSVTPPGKIAPFEPEIIGSHTWLSTDSMDAVSSGRRAATTFEPHPALIDVLKTSHFPNLGLSEETTDRRENAGLSKQKKHGPSATWST